MYPPPTIRIWRRSLSQPCSSVASPRRPQHTDGRLSSAPGTGSGRGRAPVARTRVSYPIVSPVFPPSPSSRHDRSRRRGTRGGDRPPARRRTRGDAAIPSRRRPRISSTGAGARRDGSTFLAQQSSADPYARACLSSATKVAPRVAGTNDDNARRFPISCRPALPGPVRGGCVTGFAIRSTGTPVEIRARQLLHRGTVLVDDPAFEGDRRPCRRNWSVWC